MKYIVIIIASFLVQNSGIAQDPTPHPFTLTGKIQGKDSGYVYLNYKSFDGKGVNDSCKLQNGVFSFKGLLAEPTEANFLAFGMYQIPEEKNFAQIYIEPATMQLNARINQFESLELKGSSTDNDLRKYIRSVTPINKERNVLVNSFNKYQAEYNTLQKNAADTSALAQLKMKQDSLNILIASNYKKVDRLDSAFIEANLDSYFAAVLLLQFKSDRIAFSSYENLYHKLTPKIQTSILGKKIASVIEEEKRNPIGSLAKNFSAKDSKGNSISLADYKGKKYVLLDFGASWCGPCRQMNSYLKKYYEKYNQKLEIISIAFHDDEKNWRKAIAEDQLEWPQIFDKDTIDPLLPSEKSISNNYYIRTVPLLILIDKNGQIIGKYGSFFSTKTAYLLDLENKLK